MGKIKSKSKRDRERTDTFVGDEGVIPPPSEDPGFPSMDFVNIADLPPNVQEFIEALLGLSEPIEHKPHVRVRDITLTPEGGDLGSIQVALEPCGTDIPEGHELNLTAAFLITPDIMQDLVSPLLNYVDSLITPESEAAILQQAQSMMDNNATGTVLLKRPRP